jgi:type II secretory pathway pseudopilin PulG
MEDQRPSLKRVFAAGFTLVEVLMIIALLGVLTVVSITLISDTSDEQRFSVTLKQMTEIREAMVGKWVPQSFAPGDGLGMPMNSSWIPHTGNLIGLWHLDETSGTHLVDSSCVANHGTVVGTVTLNSAGKVKTSLQANGAGGWAAPLDLSAVNVVTVVAWVNYLGCADPTQCILWEFSANYGTHNGFITSISDSSGGTVPAGSMSFGEQNSNGSLIRYASSPTLGWHHVAVVYDRSVPASNTITTYIDGTLLPTLVASSHHNNDFFGASTLYFLGRTASSFYTSAKLDEVAVWTTALSGADIANLYQRQVAGYRPLHRTTFGFLGDMGALPDAARGLADLWTNPGAPAWASDVPSRTSAGWNGPYLSNGYLGTDYSKDAWGTPYVYNSVANPATVTSLGADRVAGGIGLNADITLEIPTSLTTASVQAVIWNNGVPWAGSAQAELNAPNGSGVLIQTLTNIVPADKGSFTFASVPLGTRSVTIYEPSKAIPTHTAGPYLFTVDRPNTAVLIQATGL